MKRVSGWQALRVMVALLVRAAPVALGVHAVLVIGAAVAPAVLAAATGQVVEGMTAGEPSLPVGPAVVAAAAMVVFGVVAAIGSSAELIVGERFTAAVEQWVMRTAVGLPGLELFDDPQFAERLEITRWTSGGDFSGGGGAARAYMDVTVVVRHLVGVTATAVVLADWGWWAPALVLATMVPFAFVTWRHGGAQAREELAGGIERRRSDWFLGLGLGAEGAKEIRLFGLDHWVSERHHASWQKAFAGVLAALSGHARREAIIASCTAAAVVIVVVSAATRTDSGALAPGALVTGLLALPALLSSARSLARAPGDSRYRLAHLPQVAAVLQISSPPATIGQRAPAAGPAELRFEGVGFAYPQTDRRVLDGFDLVVEPGTSLALVGANGCGKSTLVKLLCRFYEPDEGRILLDGVDIRDLDLPAMRARIATLFQDPVRYPFSLHDNIAVGRLDRPDLVEAAATAAGVDAIAARLGDQPLDPTFGGVDLSGGEWQRVALARTLTAARGNEAGVIVADEPTAHLDVRTEYDLYQRFASLTEGRTTILISHRFSTVRMADRVAVLEGGRVVEDGDHASLVAAGGRYAELYTLQGRQFESVEPSDRGDHP